MIAGRTYIPISSNSSLGGACVPPEGYEAIVGWIVSIGFLGVGVFFGLVAIYVLKEEGWLGFMLGVFIFLLLVGLTSMPIVKCLL